MLKNKIIILSDIHGWLPDYCRDMPNVICIDSRELAKIDLTCDVHSQFISGGLDYAASLLSQESADLVIGLSVGGTIAWRAALLGMKCRKLIAISATRLRFEPQKPECELNLIYGEKDPFRPTNEWFEKLNLSFNVIDNASHEVYKELEILTL